MGSRYKRYERPERRGKIEISSHKDGKPRRLFRWFVITYFFFPGVFLAAMSFVFYRMATTLFNLDMMHIAIIFPALLGSGIIFFGLGIRFIREQKVRIDQSGITLKKGDDVENLISWYDIRRIKAGKKQYFKFYFGPPYDEDNMRDFVGLKYIIIETKDDTYKLPGWKFGMNNLGDSFRFMAKQVKQQDIKIQDDVGWLSWGYGNENRGFDQYR